MNLKIKRVNPNAQLPTYGSAQSSCFDLRAIFEGPPVTIEPGKQARFDTGLAFEFPEGWGMDVYSRSGHGFMKSVRLSNSVGIIDNDFRDTVKVALHNDSSEPFVVASGDRIAQARLVETVRVEFVEVTELNETARGLGGLGSTGVK